MKIKFTKTTFTEHYVEIELPYFFSYGLTDDDSDSVLYGRIDEKTQTTIRERSSWRGDVSFEIEKDSPSNCYFDDKYKSSKEDFYSAKARALAFLNEC